MRVLFVTSEVNPLAKSGGLADVSRALSLALRRTGADVRVIIPGYNSAIAQLKNPRIEVRLPPPFGVEPAYLISGILPGTDVPVFLIYAPSLYTRQGTLYQDASHRDWSDNPRRFAYLAQVASWIGTGRLCGWKPDIVHANDWHTGLVPLFITMAEGARPATVFTIHNLSFQGNFAPAVMEDIGVPPRLFNPDGVEFYGQFSFLKAALRYANKITTVSPRYGREILTPEFGCGFDGLLRSREQDLNGILNGIDVDAWNPATDPALAKRYSLSDMSGKRACKADFQQMVGLQHDSRPLLGFVSRITRQKMADILAGSISDIVALGAQVAIVGDGEPEIAKELMQLEARYPGQIAFRAYDEMLAHRLQAGADILLAPARFEPCGLTQIHGMRYGSIPVVRRTGGLADTVVDATDLAGTPATGFTFDEVSREGLLDAISRALASWREPLIWRRLQMAAMSQDFSWRSSAQKYLSIYRSASGLPLPNNVDLEVPGRPEVGFVAQGTQ
jgi:starch synthase